MADGRKPAAEADKARWGELFQGDRAIYTVMVMLGVVLFSLQILIIVTIMPTVVADIGGAAYYVWASMLYQVGAIVGAACVGPLWRATGMRNGFLITSTVYALGTLGCALAPDMLVLNVSRTVQGLAGGLITGGTMGVVSRLFHPSQRTRVLALYQGTWTICSLLGPFVGGGFADMGWWRGSFWATVPLAVVFGAIAWWKIPAADGAHAPGRPDERPGIPLLRLTLLACGVLGVAAAGQLAVTGARIAALVLSLALIWAAFRIDARETHRLFPTKPLSITRAVGLGYWMLILVGGVQAAITVFMPLQLQVVYGLRPIWVGVANLIVSTGWTISTFLVSGWSGARERFALNSGPVLILLSAFMLLPTVGHEALWLIMTAMFVFGWGIGSHNVHLGARVMGNALKGEESITAASQSMMRSLGGAIGTAAGGMVANMAGLGEQIDVATVNDAIFAVYVASAVPLAFGVVFIVRMTRLVVPRVTRVAE
jgi:MFS family permease